MDRRPSDLDAFDLTLVCRAPEDLDPVVLTVVTPVAGRTAPLLRTGGGGGAAVGIVGSLLGLYLQVAICAPFAAILIP